MYTSLFVFGAFHLVHTQLYMLSGPTHPFFACNTQWKCIGGLTPPTSPRCVHTKWKAPLCCWCCTKIITDLPLIVFTCTALKHFDIECVSNTMIKDLIWSWGGENTRIITLLLLCDNANEGSCEQIWRSFEIIVIFVYTSNTLTRYFSNIPEMLGLD